MQNQELAGNEYTKLSRAYEQAEKIVHKRYLRSLGQYEIAPLDEMYNNRKNVRETVRLIRLHEVVFQKGEGVTEKLASVYSAVAGSGSDLIFVIDSNGNESGKVDFYFGVKNIRNVQALSVSADVLKRSVLGNFPGSRIEEIRGDAVQEKIDECFFKGTGRIPAVASVTGVPQAKDAIKEQGPDGKRDRWPGIERFIDAMSQIAYTAIFFAEAKDTGEMLRVKEDYENLYTSLAPLAKRQISYNEGLSQSINDSISNSISNSISKGSSFSNNYSSSYGESATKGESKGRNIGFAFAASIGSNSGKSQSRTDSLSVAEGIQYGENEAYAKSFTGQWAKGQSVGVTSGLNTQIEMENKRVSDLLKKIDRQLERLGQIGNASVFEFGAYFVAYKKEDAMIAADMYQSLMLSHPSEAEGASVNVWQEEKSRAKICSYLERLINPVFHIGEGEGYGTNSVFLSSCELAQTIGFPAVSVPGLDVMEHAAFGRNVRMEENARRISPGKLSYLGTDYEKEVFLDIDSFTSHVFVTGSTGVGKTNTVVVLIQELMKKDIPFLIIEPTKGEYKEIFWKNAKVYGTNPKETGLLRLNPFSFPEQIHILEHIDRISEIFNACWPMYAAMPAILKQAIEQAYAASGWDLNKSTNRFSHNGRKIYPDFTIVLSQIKHILEHSAFSADNQGDYIGALCTRVGSLTTGIFQNIFVNSDEEEKGLFDDNAIVDLSRVFSSDAKALLMGILVMKLQEYRMSEKVKFNSGLRHITVLEEAHNLLRKTSTEQSDEGANLMGKSVEMLSNAIAEMRTYGEGFMIADQAPGLLDMSVIRNTNTKVILRLPERGDRELVGRAASLNEGQIEELARLETGVAAVYQNNWQNAVLCHIKKAKAFEGGGFACLSEFNLDKLEDMEEVMWWALCDSSFQVIDLMEKIFDSEFRSSTKIFLLRLLNGHGIPALREQIVKNEFWDARIFEQCEFLLTDFRMWKEEMAYQLCGLHPYLKEEGLIQKILMIQSKLMVSELEDIRYEAVMLKLAGEVEGHEI